MGKLAQGHHSQLFSPPQLALGILERTRLYNVMDQAPKDRPLYLWGPPGAGKSTLAIGYLRARALPAVWYRVNGSEQDMGALLTRLTERLHKQIRERSQASSPVLVLDDYHLAPDHLHRIPAEALRDGARVILISRSDPAAGLRRALVDRAPGFGALTRLGWQRLRLTLAEARQLGRRYGNHAPQAIRTLHATSGGWAAGFCHLLENTISPQDAHQAASEVIGDYLGTHPHPPLTPPTLGPPGPWRVAIHALSAFAIHTPAGPLRHYRKPPRRPMELLKRLLAAGPDGEAENRVIGGLWPTSRGSAAVRVLATTLHRLRTLLGDHRVVLREGGWLRLDPTKVWVDAWALESVLTQLPPPSDTPSPLPSPQVRQLTAALALYHSPLLAGDALSPWLLVPRRRLHGLVLHHTTALGGHQEATEAWSDAEATYHRGIATDPTAEPLYEGLMRTLAAQGRLADLVDAYRQLENALDGSPSRATRDLLRHFSQAQPKTFPVPPMPPMPPELSPESKQGVASERAALDVKLK